MKRLFILILVLLAAPSWGAICTITEHKDLYVLPSGHRTPMPDDPYRRQSVTYTTSTASAIAFGTATKYIGVSCNALAHYSMATSPTATASDTIIPASVLVFFPVTAGEKIAFYDGSS